MVQFVRSYSRKLEDLIKIQTEIAQQISDKLQYRLSAEDRRRLAATYDTNSEGYQLFLKDNISGTRVVKKDSFRQSSFTGRLL